VPQGESSHSKYFKGYNKEGKETILGNGVRQVVFEVRNDLITDDKEYQKLRRAFTKLI
jgi:predicted N-formylglutamate amidohydrolase